MKLFDPVNWRSADELADLSYAPPLNWFKLVILGLLLPWWLGSVAHDAWTTELARWLPGRNRYGGGGPLMVRGLAAQWLAAAHLGIALLCFSRWVLGALRNDFFFNLGTGIAAVLIAGGFAGAFFCAMAY